MILVFHARLAILRLDDERHLPCAWVLARLLFQYIGGNMEWWSRIPTSMTGVKCVRDSIIIVRSMMFGVDLKHDQCGISSVCCATHGASLADDLRQSIIFSLPACLAVQRLDNESLLCTWPVALPVLVENRWSIVCVCLGYQHRYLV